MKNEDIAVKNIPGWGIDEDPGNEPTYPMKHYTGDDHNRLHYDRPPQQPLTVEVLQSVERPGLPAVFGTSVPPSGLSGVIRRIAFRYSEGSFKHWLPLILADRINIVEGVLGDLRRGHIPNVFAERGWKAEWKYNKAGLMTRVVSATFVTAAVVGFLIYKRRKRS